MKSIKPFINPLLITLIVGFFYLSSKTKNLDSDLKVAFVFITFILILILLRISELNNKK
jgi:Gpi18-like mannosyltransferase